MHTITALSAEDFPGRVDALAGLLAEVVADGHSLGFRAPFGRAEAAEWWRAQGAAVAGGDRRVWVAEGPGGVTGTVSLALEGKPNGRHRAEILKLMVHRDARGQGLGRALLAAAEESAARSGARLLLLDTETGSAAERVYHRAGWTRYGVVPEYAASPGGDLKDCSFFFKRLPWPAPAPRGARL